MNTEEYNTNDVQFIDDAEIRIYWPTKTSDNDQFVLFTDAEKDKWADIKIGDKTYYSNVFLNVKNDTNNKSSSYPDIIFNIANIIGIIENDKPERFHIIGDIFFIDKDDNKIILKDNSYVKINNNIFYMPDDLYFALDLNTGNFVFRNAKEDSELFIKYISFFLVRASDYEILQEKYAQKMLTAEEKDELDYKAIEGYDQLNPTQQNQIKEVLDKILYNNEGADIVKFKNDIDKKASESESRRLTVPIKEDGNIDIDLFVSQICPEYAKEEVDLSKIEFDSRYKYLPVINEHDFANLSLLGFAPKDIRNLFTTLKNTCTTCFNSIQDVEDRMRAIKNGYDKAYSLCLSLITNDSYNSNEYNQTVKNSYYVIAEMIELENEYRRAKELFDSAQNNLAAFQTISRKTVQKALDDGEFTNRHTFSSLLLFFKTMCSEGCISAQGNKDEEKPELDLSNNNYGVYITYLKYINKKYNEINHDNYFYRLFENTIDPSREPNGFKVIEELMHSFIKLSDFSEVSKEEAMNRIMQRVHERLIYLQAIAYYPVSFTIHYLEEIFNIFTNTTDEIKKINSEEHEKYIENLISHGWPVHDQPILSSDDAALLISISRSINEKLNNNETYEAIVGLLEILRLTILNECLNKLSSKPNKNNGEIFKTCIVYNLILNIANGIEIIKTKEMKNYDDENNIISTSVLDDHIIKSYLVRFLANIISLINFSSISLRLNYAMHETALSIADVKENDTQSFFSIIINALMIPIEVMEKAHDMGNSEENTIECDNIISKEKTQFLGNESTKIFYNGLKGMESIVDSDGENKSITSLYNGRKEFIQESIIYTTNIFKIIDSFLEACMPSDE
jgi:hypothetical protein